MITSKDNELIKETAKLIKSAKARKDKHLFVAEGLRLCRDAAESGAHIVFFLYTGQAAEKNKDDFALIRSVADKSEEISRELYNKISDTNSPQGFLCAIDTGSNTAMSEIKSGGKYAALENIQDPSNLGTILRTAEALGIDGVILSHDCCDIYSPKVVRGSMGAVFRLPFMQTEDFTAWIQECTATGVSTYASTPHEAENIRQIDFSGGGIMLIGNEGNGLKSETIEACTRRVKIPMFGRAESLNAAAAAAILMYELMNHSERKQGGEFFGRKY